MDSKKKVRVKSKAGSAEWKAIQLALCSDIKHKPTLEMIRDKTKGVLTQSDSRNMYYALQKTAPELWKLERKAKIRSEKVRNNVVKSSWSEAEAQMFDSFVKMVGLSQNKSWKLLLRAFALAAAKNQINLTELVPAAKKLSDAELLHLNKLFTRIGLAGM